MKRHLYFIEIKDPPIKKIKLKLEIGSSSSSILVVVIYSLYFVKVYGAMTVSVNKSIK